MEEIKFSDFRIVPDINSVHKEVINDEQYFGDNYKRYISNSRLKWIDPSDGGSPQLFKNPPKLRSTCLSLGSAIHECILEPNEFYLAPKIGKPTAKLGLVMDEIDSLVHKENNSDLEDIMRKAALKVDYFSKTINSKISNIKQVWLEYSQKLEEVRNIDTNKTAIVLSDSDWDIATNCINSIKSNDVIMNTLFPKDTFMEPFEEVFCEDALFADFIVIYKEKQCAVLPFKLKIDNWNINSDTNIITLNDIKTTGHSTNIFMENSFQHFRYYRQLGVYMSILELYVDKELGLSTKNGWKFESNICCVETIPNYWSRCFKISEEELHRGIQEFSQLMKRVAACEIFGYDAELNFI